MASRKFKTDWIPSPLTSSKVISRPPEPPPRRPRTLLGWARFFISFWTVWLAREVVRWTLSALFGRKERSRTAGRESREYCERMGGMWIIVARLCSLRSDLLGVEFCDELSRTRDHAEPLPCAQIRKIIDKALTGIATSFDEVFSEFDEQPLATRSFGQFHTARLKQNGKKVVVRVRAPDAVERARTDLKYLRLMIFFMNWLEVEPQLQWEDMLFEVKKATDDLLDFRTEVTELRRIGKLLRPRRVYVPIVFGRLCTEEILITEYIEGVSISDLRRVHTVDRERCDAWMKANQIDRRKVWRRLFNSHQELLFEHKLFFTELQPSAILLLRNSRIALVSLNSCGSVETELLRNYRALCQALVAGDYSKVCDTYLAMGPALPHKDISTMRGSAQRALRAWESRTHVKGSSYHEKSVATALGELARCANDHEMPAFWSLARLQASVRTLDQSLSFLDSTKSSIKSFKRYEKSAQLRTIKRVATKGVRKRVNNAVDVAQLNMQLAENFQHDAEYLRRRLINAQSKVGKIAQIVGRFMMLAGKIALVGLTIQIYLYVKRHHNVTLPLGEQSNLDRILAQLSIHSRATWIAVVLGLLYFRRVLIKLARQLFQVESGPST